MEAIKKVFLKLQFLPSNLKNPLCINFYHTYVFVVIKTTHQHAGVGPKISSKQGGLPPVIKWDPTSVLLPGSPPYGIPRPAP
jgi:hypothetical protein